LHGPRGVGIGVDLGTVPDGSGGGRCFRPVAIGINLAGDAAVQGGVDRRLQKSTGGGSIG